MCLEILFLQTSNYLIILQQTEEKSQADAKKNRFFFIHLKNKMIAIPKI